MNEYPCNIIRDLLPLYADNVCSDDSRAAVEGHLSGCPSCRKQLRDMEAEVCLPAPELGEEKVLHLILYFAFGTVLIVLMLAACLVVNGLAAWEGGPARPVHLVMTGAYILFWLLFNTLVRDRPLIRISFSYGLVTLITAVLCLVIRLSAGQSLLTAIVGGAIIAIPFYGFRLFLGWNGTYVLAVITALCWVLHSGYYLYRLQRRNG